jgi:hypothetical protein
VTGAGDGDGDGDDGRRLVTWRRERQCRATATMAGDVDVAVRATVAGDVT